MEKQITIIIPTYNMEAYIGKCLDSLLIPEIDEVEVLVVNDGSKDRSSEIAHNYAARYPKSIRVIDKPNGNYGSCINAALSLCNGRYIKILDADDSFDISSFSILVKMLPDIEADAIITPYLDVNENGKETRRDNFESLNIELNKLYQIKDISPSIFVKFSAMHRLAYNAEIFTRLDYHQTEGISYTDNQWDKIPLAFAENVFVTDIFLYRYLLGREGQTMSPAQRAKSLSQIIKIARDLITMYESYGYSSPQNEFLYDRILSFAQTPFRLSMGLCTQENMNQLQCYDENLKMHHLAFYKALSQMTYSDRCKFNYIADIRRRNYPVCYQLPFPVRTKIAVNYRFRRLMSIFFNIQQ